MIEPQITELGQVAEQEQMLERLMARAERRRRRARIGGRVARYRALLSRLR